MAPIPGGTFLVNGSDVTVAAFELDLTEVTTAAYAGCVKSRGCTPGATDAAACNYGKPSRATHPINCVDWAQAAAFCKWAGKRLPSKDEWEQAARGGTEARKYSIGSTDPQESATRNPKAPENQLCWLPSWERRAGTCAVGSFPRGAFGLADMAGNVWEWTSTPYAKDGDAQPRHIGRGGGWDADSIEVFRAAHWAYPLSSDQSPSQGFRCAR